MFGILLGTAGVHPAVSFVYNSSGPCVVDFLADNPFALPSSLNRGRSLPFPL